MYCATYLLSTNFFCFLKKYDFRCSQINSLVIFEGCFVKLTKSIAIKIIPVKGREIIINKKQEKNQTYVLTILIYFTVYKNS